jgi:hypothetical protein
MRLLVLAAVVVVASACDADAQSAPDACRVQIPESITRLMTQKFPQYRLPLVTDSSPDNIQFNIADGGSGCLFVTGGDFNGDKRKDFVVGLIPKTGHVPVVAVGLSQGSSWTLSTVISRVDIPASLYVTRVPPGSFKRSEALNSRLERDERRSLRCRNDAVIVGATESTGIVYCYINNRWLYVWVSD